MVTTTRTLTEPSWHRRVRRQRADARVLLRLASAAERLQCHHSRQMAPFSKKNYWVCKVVSSDYNGKGPTYPCNGTNYLANEHCRFCGCERPPWANGSGTGVKQGQTDTKGKGKGKGKGKHKGKSANQDSKPEMLATDVWAALTKEQKRRYCSGKLAKQDAVQLAKSNGPSGIAPLRNAADDQMDTGTEVNGNADLALTQRDFEVRLGTYFDKVVNPKQTPKDKLVSTEEALCAMLTKGPRTSAEAAEKTRRLEAAKDALTKNDCDMVRGLLQKEVDSLEKQLKELSVAGDEQAAAVSEKAAYVNIREKLDREAEDKRQYREKKMAESERNSEAFLAAIAEARAQLTQLEAEFVERRDNSRKLWAQNNADSDAHSAALRRLACERMEAAEKRIAEKKGQNVVSTSPVSVGTASSATTAAAAAAPLDNAAAMEEMRIRENVIRQLESRKEVYAEHLRCFKEAPLTPEELPTAHLMWNWIKGVEFEDQMLPYTYAMLGVTGEDLNVFLGKKATEILFTMANSPHDVVPLQVRQLIGYQLKMLDHKLQEAKTSNATSYEEQEQKAKASLKKHLPALRESRKTGIRHVKK